MIERSLLKNMLSILIGTLLSYALSQIEDSFYDKIAVLINYKWLLICSLMIILTLCYFLISKPKSNKKQEPFQTSIDPENSLIDKYFKKKDNYLKSFDYYQDEKFGYLVNKKTGKKICTNCFYEYNNEIQLTRINENKYKCPIKKCEQVYPVHNPTARGLQR